MKNSLKCMCAVECMLWVLNNRRSETILRATVLLCVFLVVIYNTMEMEHDNHSDKAVLSFVLFFNRNFLNITVEFWH